MLGEITVVHVTPSQGPANRGVTLGSPSVEPRAALQRSRQQTGASLSVPSRPSPRPSPSQITDLRQRLADSQKAVAELEAEREQRQRDYDKKLLLAKSKIENVQVRMSHHTHTHTQALINAQTVKRDARPRQHGELYPLFCS